MTQGCVQDVSGPYSNQNQCVETCEDCAEEQQYDTNEDDIVDACCPLDKEGLDTNGDGVRDFCGCLPEVCDDGNANTINDMITQNCACEGESYELSITDPYECGEDIV